MFETNAGDQPTSLPAVICLLVQWVFAPGTTVSSSGSLLMVSVNLMPCASMLAYHPPFVGSSSQMALGGGSWRPDARKVPLSATREIGVVQLAEVGGRAPLLVPILLGGPSVLQGFLPLLEGGG